MNTDPMTGGPAFPVDGLVDEKGLTVLDVMSLGALVGLLAGDQQKAFGADGDTPYFALAARNAYQLGAEMLRARCIALSPERPEQ